MKYLLVNHVPLGRGDAPGTYRVGDLWLQDLAAQARAIQSVGGSLTVATPCLDSLDAKSGRGFGSKEIRPQDHGFDYVPLPAYNSLKTYRAVKRQLADDLARAISSATIVQCDYGGYPFSLGQFTWPIAGKAGKKRIWIFDGGDPFPQWRFAANQDKNIVKRQAKLWVIRRFESFLRSAIPEADLVFAHNNSVVTRFKNVWGPHCHRFDRSFVTDDLLLSQDQIAQRQAVLRDASKPLRMVAAGRQIAIKGTELVLRAMKRAIAGGARLELEVLGDGEELSKYKALATELGLDSAVRFSGTIPYGPRLFDNWATQHVMVITNLTSEFSRNIILGMARGLPLLTYSNPGDALVEENNAGLVVPMGDIEKLSEAMLEADKNRERLAPLVAKGVDLARERTLDRCHQRRAELAAECVAQRSAAA
ncbi:MAG TPA: glycosyltransferase family 4 protein [Tepidisphaeraceae bacterium]|nr:glycosyltransferase family 4 protein [Tepidisphaeraceae bacterium]